MRRIAILALLTLTLSGIVAQQVNTLYFLENAPMRYQLNPAYKPLSDLYIGFPALGGLSLWGGNNSITLGDLIHIAPATGKPMWVISNVGNDARHSFYDKLRVNTTMGVDLNVNLLSFGWAYKESYWHVFMGLKQNFSTTIPRGLIKFGMFGMEDLSATNYNMTGLGLNENLYIEGGLGYSRNITDQIRVGGSLKFLYGIANMQMTQSDLSLSLSPENAHLKGVGNLLISAPIQIPTGGLENLGDISISENLADYLTPSGLGAAIDLGATYKPLDVLTVSFSVTDLGFLSWSKSPLQLGYEADYMFEGFKQVGLNTDFESLLDSVVTGLENSAVVVREDKGYCTMISPRINVGADVNFFDNRLGAGVIYSAKFMPSNSTHEITVGAAYRPFNWLNLAANYSLLNGRWSTIGAGLGLRAGPFNLTIMADYVPFHYTSIDNIPIPSRTKGFNLGFGLNFVFGNKQDKDKDGVPDKLDMCEQTPKGVLVDEHGCPLDTDGDDVPDYLDKCENSPVEARGMVDEFGCPIDTDGDGVPDYMDKCPDTPKEAYDALDVFGCPLDSDMDGVPDYQDKCADTPPQAIGKVDASGCPLDSDGDGVDDYLDRCADTPQEAAADVDEHGCPNDNDGDGIPNYLDKCPNTAAEAVGFINEFGCDKDTDGDGIPDYLDACIRTPGVKENRGCPEVKREVRSLFTRALQGISFTSGRAVIRSSSYKILNDIAKVLHENPTYKIEIQGHTDNVGKAELNQKLSEERAHAVRNYLIKKGVDKDRMTAVGFGQDKPVADNKTSSGRYKNRRVEFVISFEEVRYE